MRLATMLTLCLLVAGCTRKENHAGEAPGDPATTPEPARNQPPRREPATERFPAPDYPALWKHAIRWHERTKAERFPDGLDVNWDRPFLMRVELQVDGHALAKMPTVLYHFGVPGTEPEWIGLWIKSDGAIGTRGTSAAETSINALDLTDETAPPAKVYDRARRALNGRSVASFVLQRRPNDPLDADPVWVVWTVGGEKLLFNVRSGEFETRPDTKQTD